MKKILLTLLAISAFAASITFSDLTPDGNDSSVILQQKMVAAVIANTVAVTNSSGGGDLDTTAIDTSAELRDIVTDESGTGALLFVGAAEISASQTGTHASPSTTNPLSPTWTGPLHTVWYGATGQINLPAAASYTGKAILIYNTGAFTITIEPNSSEVIVRDGTAQTGGANFTLSSGAGNYVSLFCDGARWVTLGFKGTLTVGS